MSHKIFGEAGRFLSVGVWNTVIGLTVIYVVKWLWGLNDAAANLIGYAAGLVVSFSLNGRWTFAYQGPYGLALARFAMVTVAAYAMNLVTVLSAIHYLGVNGYVAQAMGIPAYTLTSFLACKFWVFRPS